MVTDFPHAPVLQWPNVSLAPAEGADIAQPRLNLVSRKVIFDQIASALKPGPRIRRIIRQNLAWALAYNLTAMSFSGTD